MGKADTTRAALLDAAVKVFGRSGYSGATVDQIAEVAGVSKGDVYYHFKTKGDIATSVLEDGVEHILELFREAVKQSESGIDALHCMVTALSRNMFLNPRFSRFMLTELWRDDRIWAESMRSLEERCLSLIERQIERGQGEGSLRKTFEARFGAVAVMGTVLTSAQYYLLREQPGTTDEKARQFVHRVTDYVSHALGA